MAFITDTRSDNAYLGLFEQREESGHEHNVEHDQERHHGDERGSQLGDALLAARCHGEVIDLGPAEHDHRVDGEEEQCRQLREHDVDLRCIGQYARHEQNQIENAICEWGRV